MPVIEPEKAEEIIPDKHLAFDLSSEVLQKWFSQFGFEDEETKLELYAKIEASGNNPYEINNVCGQVLEEVFN